jgi:tetratricopeptide (TPR) repeat protein
LNAGSSTEAIQVYNSKISEDVNNENKIKNKITKNMNQIKEDFTSNKINYSDATSKIKKYSNLSLVSSDFMAANKYIDELNNSRGAFIKAAEYENNNDSYNAVQEYQKVIEQDQNYIKAQNKIKSLSVSYKAKLLADVETLVKKQNYSDAISKLEQALNILHNDTDLTVRINQLSIKKQEIGAKEEAVKIQNLKNNQKLVVTSARAYDDGYSIVLRKATVIVKNVSDKVVKNYEIGILMFDDNGYPVDVEFSFEGEGNLFKAYGQSANILSGQSYGNNRYLDIADNTTKIKACIISVDFTDGTTWENEYFNYWLNTEKDIY